MKTRVIPDDSAHGNITIAEKDGDQVKALRNIKVTFEKVASLFLGGGGAQATFYIIFGRKV